MRQGTRGAAVEHRHLHGASRAPELHGASRAPELHGASRAPDQPDAVHAPEHHAAVHGPKALWERRHSFRVQVPARASVFHKGKLCGYYTVHDISIGGCLLRGGLTLPVSETVDVLLHLPHRAPLALSARELAFLKG